MAVKVDIPAGNLVGLSDVAERQLEDCLLSFANDVISEANRMEATARPASAQPDINAQMIRDAAFYVRRMPIVKASSGWNRIGRAVSATLAVALGLFWDKSSLNDSVYLVQFGILFALTILITTAVTLKD